MSEIVPRSAASQTTQNIDLAFRLLDDLFVGAGTIDQLPADATLVLLPYKDPHLGLLNLGVASQLAGRGEKVYLKRVGIPATAPDRWGPGANRALIPKWPTDWDPHAERLVAYDHEANEWRLVFFPDAEEPRTGTPFPISEYIVLLVDPVTQEVVGQAIPDFLTYAVRRFPRLLELLDLAALKGITRTEVNRLQAAHARKQPTDRTYEAFASDLASLIA